MTAGVEPAEELRVRVWDRDLDENRQPCTIEADAIVHFDAERVAWFAEYDPAAMAWIPPPTLTSSAQGAP